MPGDTAHFTNRPARIPLTTVVIVTWGLILTLALVGLNGISIGGRTVLSIKGLDPMYYFGTSHSLLFEHNFDLRNEFAVLKPQATDAGGFRGLNGLPGSPYAIGYSILSLPLLAVGTALDGAAGRPANGYEGAAIFFYFLGNVLFTVIGMWCLSRFLQAFGLPLWQSAFLPLAIWFSTSLGYYTFTPMAHAATFLLSAAFLLIWWRNRESERVRDWVALGLCGGISCSLPLAGCDFPDRSAPGGLIQASRGLRAALVLMGFVCNSGGSMLASAVHSVEGTLWQIPHHSARSGIYGVSAALYPERPVFD